MTIVLFALALLFSSHMNAASAARAELFQIHPHVQRTAEELERERVQLLGEAMDLFCDKKNSFPVRRSALHTIAQKSGTAIVDTSKNTNASKCTEFSREEKRWARSLSRLSPYDKKISYALTPVLEDCYENSKLRVIVARMLTRIAHREDIWLVLKKIFLNRHDDPRVRYHVAPILQRLGRLGYGEEAVNLFPKVAADPGEDPLVRDRSVDMLTYFASDNEGNALETLINFVRDKKL